MQPLAPVPPTRPPRPAQLEPTLPTLTQGFCPGSSLPSADLGGKRCLRPCSKPRSVLTEASLCTDLGIDEHTHTMAYYSAIKKDGIMPFATSWMDLEVIILSEESQPEKGKCHVTTFMIVKSLSRVRRFATSWTVA